MAKKQSVMTKTDLDLSTKDAAVVIAVAGLKGKHLAKDIESAVTTQFNLDPKQVATSRRLEGLERKGYVTKSVRKAKKDERGGRGNMVAAYAPTGQCKNFVNAFTGALAS